jgi:hypothetical protein
MTAAVLAAGMALGVMGMWVALRQRGTVVVTTGTVTAVDSERTSRGIRFDDRAYEVAGDGEGVAVVADPPWTAADGSSHSGTWPPCLSDSSYGHRVEFEVLDVAGTRVRYVVGVHCLT